MTTADTISAFFNDDGQCFSVETEEHGNVTLDEVCRKSAAYVISDGFDKISYIFSDDSVVTVAGDGWDLGFIGCWCWQGAGHSDECIELSYKED